MGKEQGASVTTAVSYCFCYYNTVYKMSTNRQITFEI